MARPAPARPRLLFYVQHLLGIGHLRRAATLTRGLQAAGFDVTLVSGGHPVPGLDVGAARLVQLPPVRAVDKYFKLLVDDADRPIDDAWRAARRDRLLAVYAAAQPAVLLVELFPFGRRQMRFELEPLLQHARATAPAPLIACSVRDILVEPDKPERVDEMVARVQRYFDLVLVHGDPALIPFDATFPRAAELAARLRYTGYIVEPPARAAPADGAGAGEVVVSTGGGAVSEPLLDAALAARPLTGLATAPWRLLVGHNLPEDRFAQYRAQAGPGMIVERARPDFTAMLAACRLSISQGGYNTVMEVLAAGARAVCVPYSGGLETEQTLRCRLLAERGVLQMVEEAALTPQALAAAVARALAAPPASNAGIAVDGTARSAAYLLQSLA